MRKIVFSCVLAVSYAVNMDASTKMRGEKPPGAVSAVGEESHRSPATAENKAKFLTHMAEENESYLTSSAFNKAETMYLQADFKIAKFNSENTGKTIFKHNKFSSMTIE